MTDISVPGTVQTSKIKSLVGKKISKDVKFCGDTVKITKLSVAQIEEIQSLARETNSAPDGAKDDGMGIIRFVIRTSVEGADQLEDTDFQEFPMEELTTLTNAIMSFSGMQNEGK